MKIFHHIFIVLLFLGCTNVNNENSFSQAPKEEPAPEIEIGSVFSNTKDLFKLIDLDRASGKKYYEYLKPIGSLVYGHNADKLVVVVKDNLIYGYSFFLIPQPGESEVPLSIINRFEQETGVQLQKIDNDYGLRTEELMVSISFSSDKQIGGDRIMIYVLRGN